MFLFGWSKCFKQAVRFASSGDVSRSPFLAVLGLTIVLGQAPVRPLLDCAFIGGPTKCI